MNFLIIQTAHLGDTILATAIPEKLKKYYPSSSIDFFIRKGNEDIFLDNPNINNLFVWDKKNNKYQNLISLIKTLRQKKYDYVFNLQRFYSSALVTILSNANTKVGFNKTLFQLFYDKRINHTIKNNIHEIERNNKLIEFITDNKPEKPKSSKRPNFYLGILPPARSFVKGSVRRPGS